MDSLWSLYDLLCEKVDEVVKTGDISPTEMDNVYKATKTMYYIECIAAMEDADDYDSGVSGNWPYSNNNTSMRRGRNSRNSYASNTSRRSGRNSMKNYSGHDQKEMMLQKIAEMQRQIEDME